MKETSDEKTPTKRYVRKRNKFLPYMYVEHRVNILLIIVQNNFQNINISRYVTDDVNVEIHFKSQVYFLHNAQCSASSINFLGFLAQRLHFS